MPMIQKYKSIILAISVLVAFLILNSIYHFTGGHGKFIDALIERNITARGGAEVWRAVSTIRFKGQMDLGKDMRVPYLLEQKRPGKMCLEFVFNKEKATQCINGDTGWKRLPFRGRTEAESMTDSELKQMVDMAAIDGLLFDSDKRGHKITLASKEEINGRNVLKLKLVLPEGAIRWVYIDEESALEIKLEMTRILRGKEQLVETHFTDWRNIDGLLIPHRQETRTKGSAKSNFITVESVMVNTPIDDSRFKMPAKATVKKSPSGNKPS